MPPILLIDTYSLFFRAFHALPAMQTSRGEPTSAVFGFSVLLLKVMREHAPAGLAFAMDKGPGLIYAPELGVFVMDGKATGLRVGVGEEGGFEVERNGCSRDAGDAQVGEPVGCWADAKGGRE